MADDSPEEVPNGFPGTPARSSMPDWYPDLLASVTQHVSTGHRRAVAAANAQLLGSYWAIGKEIATRMQQEGWGAKVIDRLSADLRERFPDARGYSPRNLRYMRSFAGAWPDLAMLQQAAATLPWTHQMVLLDKLDGPDLRRWYAERAVEEGWSRGILALQIEGRLHERAGRAVTNFASALPPPDSDLAQQATRDPYLFDFLGTVDERNERDVERALVDHVSQFLLELGQGFAYVGQQVRLVVGGDEFFCDLLFYHARLHRYVVIELKAVRFDPGFLGQLGMYMAAVDDLLATDRDEPTIGLLLCKTKNDTVAEYALRSMNAPIGVAEWTTAITTSLPDEISASLPSIELLEAELTDPITVSDSIEVRRTTGDPT